METLTQPEELEDLKGAATESRVGETIAPSSTCIKLTEEQLQCIYYNIKISNVKNIQTT